jgi:twinkle protein
MGADNVISSTGGAQGSAGDSSEEWIDLIPDEVDRIYINYDNDEPGKKAARALAERIGIERCYNVILPQKDANDFMRAGGTLDDYRRILKQSRKFDIEGVQKIEDVLDEVRNTKIERLSTFLPRFTVYTKGGIPKKSLVVLSGRTGVGKSTALLNFMIDHANNHKPCLLISLENDIAFTLKRILEIKYGRTIDKFDNELWDRVKVELPDFPFYIDTSAKTTTFAQVEKMVKQAKKLYGIEVVGFDHIHYVLDGKLSVTQEVATMTKNFKLLCNEYDVITYLISHIRKMREDTTFITGEDLKDSSALQQLADMVILLMEIKGGMILQLDKSRMSRSHLTFPIRYNGETGVMADDDERKVKCFDKIIDENGEEKEIEVEAVAPAPDDTYIE